MFIFPGGYLPSVLWALCFLSLFFLSFTYLIETWSWFSSASQQYSKHLFFSAVLPSMMKGQMWSLEEPCSCVISRTYLLMGLSWGRWSIPPCFSSFTAFLHCPTSPAKLSILSQAICSGISLCSLSNNICLQYFQLELKSLCEIYNLGGIDTL